MPTGYVGQMLEVDLTARTSRALPLTSDLTDRWVGGTGLGAHLLYEYGAYAADPLGPDNVLIFGTGPFTGTAVPLSNRFGVCARSPLTGVFGEADCGGHWAADLKRSGFDMLILRGRADSPTYLWIHDGQVEFRDASHLWGRDTFETFDRVRAEVGERSSTDSERASRRSEDAGVVCIGPAGERLVRFAAIMNDGKDGRAAGRTGMGAVMGSKNLKAIACRGTATFQQADEAGLRAALGPQRRDVVQAAKTFGQLGTAGGVPVHDKMGNWPIRNWSQSHWEAGAEKISGAKQVESILTGRYYCGNCIIGCGRTVHVMEGPYVGIEQGGLEYETVGLNGSNLLVDNLEAIQKANELCNRYGMDTISAGATIGFAMEAYERGLIDKDWTEGVELVWGNAEALVETMRRIGEREGEFGRKLGEGTESLATQIGGEEFAVIVRGLDLPAHDPRAFYANAVAYATSNRGACHLSSWGHTFQRVVSLPEFGWDEPVPRHDPEQSPKLVYHAQNLMGLFDSLKSCKFIMFGGIKPHHLHEWYNFITGRGLTFDEFMEIGERIFNQKRLFNLAAGSGIEHDRLPERILTREREVGGTMSVPPFAEMMARYYEIRGWDPTTGRPGPECLVRLGLHEVATPDH